MCICPVPFKKPIIIEGCVVFEKLLTVSIGSSALKHNVLAYALPQDVETHRIIAGSPAEISSVFKLPQESRSRGPINCLLRKVKAGRLARMPPEGKLISLADT